MPLIPLTHKFLALIMEILSLSRQDHVYFVFSFPQLLFIMCLFIRWTSKMPFNMVSYKERCIWSNMKQSLGLTVIAWNNLLKLGLEDLAQDFKSMAWPDVKQITLSSSSTPYRPLASTYQVRGGLLKDFDRYYLVPGLTLPLLFHVTTIGMLWYAFLGISRVH